MRFLIILTVALLYTGCQQPQKTMKKPVDYAYIQQHEGEEMTLEGVYEKSVIAQGPAEDVKHAGHYRIRINDDLKVVLLPPYTEEAVRPQTEAEKFEGKKVRVTGIVYAKTYMRPPSMEYQSQSVNIPSFSEISSIELVEE